MKAGLLLTVLLCTSTLLIAGEDSSLPQVIRAQRILDGKGNVYLDAAVVIRNGRIEEINKTPTDVTQDLGAITLMPGMIDTHVHISWHFDENGRRGHLPGQMAATFAPGPPIEG